MIKVIMMMILYSFIFIVIILIIIISIIQKFYISFLHFEELLNIGIFHFFIKTIDKQYSRILIQIITDIYI